MQNHNAIRAPIFRDPDVTVRVLREIYIGGSAREVGSNATMSESDAYALACTVPATIEFLK